ncbi:MAG: hypothetical protein CME68_03670 [Halobacteriovoraceae bacterium]|nr:hypothetical protein [Halobacteriovoraceae bacterium]|tara:strand:+ start:128 stop:469 length:342 start_codon:yes stop_codon:yes gene_type:complete
MKNQESHTYYTVTYRDPKDGKTVNLKAKTIKDSNLGLSFIFVSDFILKGEGSSKIIDPNEEKLRNQLKDTKGIHLSIYTIIMIEENGPNHDGLHFENDKGKILVLPSEQAPLS